MAKAAAAFGENFETFGIEADARRVNLFTNLSLTVMVIRRALPDTLPLFVPEAADETIDVQLDAIVDVLEKLKTASSSRMVENRKSVRILCCGLIFRRNLLLRKNKNKFLIFVFIL